MSDNEINCVNENGIVTDYSGNNESISEQVIFQQHLDDRPELNQTLQGTVNNLPTDRTLATHSNSTTTTQHGSTTQDNIAVQKTIEEIVNPESNLIKGRKGSSLENNDLLHYNQTEWGQNQNDLEEDAEPQDDFQSSRASSLPINNRHQVYINKAEHSDLHCQTPTGMLLGPHYQASFYPPRQFVDVVVVYAREDYIIMKDFIGWLYFVSKRFVVDARIVPYDSEYFPADIVSRIEAIVERASYIFMLLTPNFSNNRPLKFLNSEAIAQSRLQLDVCNAFVQKKRYAVRPVHTQHEYERTYKTPSGLHSIKTIDYYDHKSQHTRETTLDILLNASKTRIWHETEEQRSYANSENNANLCNSSTSGNNINGTENSEEKANTAYLNEKSRYRLPQIFPRSEVPYQSVQPENRAKHRYAYNETQPDSTDTLRNLTQSHSLPAALSAERTGTSSEKNLEVLRNGGLNYVCNSEAVANKKPEPDGGKVKSDITSTGHERHARNKGVVSQELECKSNNSDSHEEVSVASNRDGAPSDDDGKFILQLKPPTPLTRETLSAGIITNNSIRKTPLTCVSGKQTALSESKDEQSTSSSEARLNEKQVSEANQPVTSPICENDCNTQHPTSFINTEQTKDELDKNSSYNSNQCLPDGCKNEESIGYRNEEIHSKTCTPTLNNISDNLHSVDNRKDDSIMSPSVKPADLISFRENKDDLETDKGPFSKEDPGCIKEHTAFCDGPALMSAKAAASPNYQEYLAEKSMNMKKRATNQHNDLQQDNGDSGTSLRTQCPPSGEYRVYKEEIRQIHIVHHHYKENPRKKEEDEDSSKGTNFNIIGCNVVQLGPQSIVHQSEKAGCLSNEGNVISVNNKQKKSKNEAIDDKHIDENKSSTDQTDTTFGEGLQKGEIWNDLSCDQNDGNSKNMINSEESGKKSNFPQNTKCTQHNDNSDEENDITDVSTVKTEVYKSYNQQPTDSSRLNLLKDSALFDTGDKADDLIKEESLFGYHSEEASVVEPNGIGEKGKSNSLFTKTSNPETSTTPFLTYNTCGIKEKENSTFLKAGSQGLKESNLDEWSDLEYSFYASDDEDNLLSETSVTFKKMNIADDDSDFSQNSDKVPKKELFTKDVTDNELSNLLTFNRLCIQNADYNSDENHIDDKLTQTSVEMPVKANRPKDISEEKLRNLLSETSKIPTKTIQKDTTGDKPQKILSETSTVCTKLDTENVVGNSDAKQVDNELSHIPAKAPGKVSLNVGIFCYVQEITPNLGRNIKYHIQPTNHATTKICHNFDLDEPD